MSESPFRHLTRQDYHWWPEFKFSSLDCLIFLTNKYIHIYIVCLFVALDQWNSLWHWLIFSPISDSGHKNQQREHQFWTISENFNALFRHLFYYLHVLIALLLDKLTTKLGCLADWIKQAFYYALKTNLSDPCTYLTFTKT